MSKVIPLPPYPALIIDGIWNASKHRYIIISDLHIGFESELSLKGISIDSPRLVDEMVNELIDLVRAYRADGVVILGDLKNSIGSISKLEWYRIPEFLRSTARCTNIFLVPGNHDANIEYLAPTTVDITSSSGLILQDTLLIHGHTMPRSISSTIKRIIMGHIHPTLIKDSSTLSGQRVWIYLKVEKQAIWAAKSGLLDIIVVPSFNKYLVATAEHGRRKRICPLINRVLKNDAINTAMVLTLDGSLVADTSSLQNITM